MFTRRRSLPLGLLVVFAFGGCSAPASVPDVPTLTVVAPTDDDYDLPDDDRHNLLSATPGAFPVYGSEMEDEAFALDLFEAANQARIDAGLAPLEPSACALPHASARAVALVGASELVHDSLLALSQECALEGRITGENLVHGVGSPAEFVEAWLNSPGHRANLLNPQFTQGAMACVNDPDAGGTTRMLCSHLFLG